MANNAILVVAVPQRGILPPATYELITAGRALAIASKGPLVAVVLSDKCAPHAAELAARGVDKVVSIEHAALANFAGDVFGKAAAEAARKLDAGRVLFASNVAGRALAARTAVLLKAGFAADVAEILPDGTIRRPYFSGNLVADVQFKTPVAVLAMAPMSYPRAEKGGATAPSEALSFDPGATRSQFVSFQAETSNEIDLSSAERIVSGGRGLGGADGFKKVFDFAHVIGAAVGASRAAVDSGWIPYRHQVGLTGRSVRPKLYVAVAISGQIQHLAGMSSSGTIVAINTDKAAPMMTLANIAVEGDYNELLPLAADEIRRRRGAPVAA